MTTPQPSPIVAMFTNYRLVAIATVVLLCGAPAAVALFADGNILMGLLATLLVGFSAVIVIGFWVTMVLVRRAIKAHGVIAAAEQSTALAGPAPATIKIAAVHYVLTGSAAALGAVLAVVSAVTAEGGFGIVAGALLGFICGGTSTLYFYGAKTLLKRGFPATGRTISGFLTGLFGLGLVRGVFDLDTADDDKRLAVIALAGTTAYVALPLVLLALPPSKAWLARATPAILRTGVLDPQSAQPPWPPSAPPGSPQPPGWPQPPAPPQPPGAWPQSAPPPQGPPPPAPPYAPPAPPYAPPAPPAGPPSSANPLPPAPRPHTPPPPAS